MLTRSEKARHAAQVRWESYRANKVPDIIRLPEVCHRLTVDNFIDGTQMIFLFHRGKKSCQFDVDLNGVPWRSCGFTEALNYIRKLCKRGGNR